MKPVTVKQRLREVVIWVTLIPSYNFNPFIFYKLACLQKKIVTDEFPRTGTMG